MNRFSFQAVHGLSGKTLKQIAVCSMLLDHIGFLLLPFGPLYVCFRTVGRLAFPLFSFLLIEGFLHTGNRTRYGQNLLLFAIASEIPFNLACHRTLLFPESQNVFFTLFLGLLMLTAFQHNPCLQNPLFPPYAFLSEIKNILLSTGIVVFFACLAILLRCDYQAYGIILIALLYWYRTGVFSIALPALFAAFLSVNFFGAAVFSMIFIRLYNGTRGHQHNKYFYYLFYPLHLLLLTFFSVWLF